MTIWKLIVRISDWSHRQDEAWRQAIEKKGFSWPKLLTFPLMGVLFVVMIIPIVLFVILPETVVKIARDKVRKEK